jgi:hypothetical protein
LGHVIKVAQFLAFFGIFCVFLPLSACRIQGLVEGSNDNAGPWLDALGVELSG